MTTTPTRTPTTGGRSGSDPRIAGLLLVGAMVVVMWVVEVVNSLDNYSLDRFGIRPRATDGLDGIALSPFLHGSWGHLIGNTVPFVVLGGVIALGGLARIAAVTVLVAAIGGAGVWLFAPSNTLHIGASGIVFGYAGYLVARGVFTRSPLHLGVGAVVAVIWGTTLLSGLVPRDGISWQGHLFGGLGGVVAARVLGGGRRREAPRDDLADAVARHRHAV